MIKTFDDHDILRFIYEEMTPAESDTFVAAMCEDESLMTKYEELLDAKILAESIPMYEPSEVSCAKVMEFVHNFPAMEQDENSLDTLNIPTAQPISAPNIQPLRGRIKIFSASISYATLAACITLTLIFGTTIALFTYSPTQNVYATQPENVTRTISPTPAQNASQIQWNDKNNDAKIQAMQKQLDTLKKRRDW